MGWGKWHSMALISEQIVLCHHHHRNKSFISLFLAEGEDRCKWSCTPRRRSRGNWASCGSFWPAGRTGSMRDPIQHWYSKRYSKTILQVSNVTLDYRQALRGYVVEGPCQSEQRDVRVPGEAPPAPPSPRKPWARDIHWVGPQRGDGAPPWCMATVPERTKPAHLSVHRRGRPLQTAAGEAGPSPPRTSGRNVPMLHW